jgi:AcrR family transcriptional regulator
LTTPTKTAARRTTRVLPDKKRKREARIIEAASALFARQGYAETSIEAIAHDADVAVGTVYNYFQNKSALLMRVLTSGRSESLSASAAIASAPPDDPVDAMHRLVSSQLHGANRHDRALWRVIHATAALEPDAFGHEYFLGKEQFTEQIHYFLRTLVDRNQLPTEVNVETMSKTIKYVASEVFRRYVSGEYKNIDEADKTLKDMVEFVMSAAIRG